MTEKYQHMLAAAPRYVDTTTLTSSERVPLPEPMTEEEVSDRVRSRAASNLLDHIYEHGVASEGVKFYMAAFVRDVEAEVLRRVKEANE